MFDFTTIKSKNLTRKQLLKEIKKTFYDTIKSDIDTLYKPTDVGKIFITCIPINKSLPYLLLDGSVVSKFDYPELYKVYKDEFRIDATSEIPNDNYFALPNLNNLAIIAQDEVGQYDATARKVGSNLPWRFPFNRFMDFDLSRVPELGKNISTLDQSTNTNKAFALTQQGNKYFVVKRNNNIKYLPNYYSNDTHINIEDDLKFDSVKLLFYTKYR